MKTNLLLQKAGLGNIRKTTFNTLNDDQVYGMPKHPDPEGAREGNTQLHKVLFICSAFFFGNGNAQKNCAVGWCQCSTWLDGLLQLQLETSSVLADTPVPIFRSYNDLERALSKSRRPTRTRLSSNEQAGHYKVLPFTYSALTKRRVN